MQEKRTSERIRKPPRRGRHLAFLRAAVGLAALWSLAGPAAAMTFQRLDASACEGRVCALASGAIDGDTVRNFKAFSDRERLPAGTVILLDSEGGNMAGGLELGRVIRADGFSTAVQGYNAGTRQWTAAECASACVWAFLGGLQRSVANNSKLGVHQVRFDFQTVTGVADAQMLMGLASLYLKKVGVAQDILTLALTTPADHIRWLSEDEIKRYAVAT